jgi:hypothetical protein
MSGMAFANGAIFLDFKTVRIILLVFAGNIISVLAIYARKSYVVSLSGSHSLTPPTFKHTK